MSAVLLLASATATQLNTVAQQPWVMPFVGVAVPWPWLMWGVPATLLIAALALRFAAADRNVTPAHAALLALATAALIGLWLACLARHDRTATAWHVATILTVLGLWPGRLLARSIVGVLAAGILALVSYGAIWGETRCDEPEGLRCLVSEGPRLWIPKVLDAVGVRVFVDLRGADLRGVDLSGRDLRLADLRGARLDGADLSGSNLRRARLDGVHASGSTWYRAYLNGATLTEAELRRADFRRVQAYLVNLSDGDLTDVDLRGASLSHAQLSGALVTGARLEGAYLRFVRGWSEDSIDLVYLDSLTVLP